MGGGATRKTSAEIIDRARQLCLLGVRKASQSLMFGFYEWSTKHKKSPEFRKLKHDVCGMSWTYHEKDTKTGGGQSRKYMKNL